MREALEEGDKTLVLSSRNGTLLVSAGLAQTVFLNFGRAS